MSAKGISFAFLFIFISTIVFFVLGAPVFVNAQTGAANAMCTCQMDPKEPRYCPRVACFEKVNGGKIAGLCGTPHKCEGMTFQSDVASGGLDAGALSQLSQIVQQLMSAMKGGGGGGEGAPTTDPTTGQGCTNYYQVTVPSSDPCAIYNPTAVLDAAGGTSGVSSSLLDALNGGTNTQTNVSTQLNQGNASTTSPSSTNTNTNTATNTSTVKPAAQGLSGDVRIGSAGATVIANLRQGLSEVAGFFGGSTGGASQALSAAGKLCSSRPWSGSFVTSVIPTSFFDGLCEWRGYQVGALAPQGTSKIPTTPASSGTSASQQQGTSLQPQASNVPPEVDIWAEPASVRLGTRTYIFWNTRGVAACKESGPSFSQNSLSGGASTVPISGPTTFTIECLSTASSTVKDSVTVQIAI